MYSKLLSLSLSAMLMGGSAMAEAPRVAADIAPIHSLVARVMEGVGEPALVIPSGDSPHGFSMRPSSAKALQDADIVFWMGHDLTPQLEDAIETIASNAAVTELLEVDGITLLDFRENALFEAHDHDHGEHEEDDHDHEDGHDHADHDDHDHAKDHDHDHKEAKAEDHDHDHAHGHDDAKAEDHDHDHDDHDHDEHAGHDHGEHDPHAWLSPQNAGVWLNVIAAQLSSADPDNAGTYFANAAAARAEMETLAAEVNATLEPVRGGRFIVFHDAYQYFENDFDFSAAGAISLSDASDPSPARIAEIQERIRGEGVDCVLSEPQFNADLVATVLDGTEAKTTVIDPLGSSLEPGISLYPELIRGLAGNLAECMKKG